jgi:hypothetical protein
MMEERVFYNPFANSESLTELQKIKIHMDRFLGNHPKDIKEYHFDFSFFKPQKGPVTYGPHDDGLSRDEYTRAVINEMFHAARPGLHQLLGRKFTRPEILLIKERIAGFLEELHFYRVEEPQPAMNQKT